MNRIRLLSGVAPFDDPWHPFPETSAAAADVLRAAGHAVDVRDSTPDAFTGLAGVDLLVVNTGGGANPEPDPHLWAAAYAEGSRWLADGGAVLGLHTAANTFPGWQDYQQRIGGRWLPGHSFHPPLSESVFTIVPGAEQHPVLRGLDQVEATDERYSDLVLNPSVTPLLQHRHEGVDQVMAWATERAVYDGMGHDARSYASASHRRLLANAVEWLLAQ